MKKKFTWVAIILLILLLVRFVAQIVVSASVTVLQKDLTLASLITIINGALYLAAIIGIVIRQKWGAILTGIIAALDTLSSVIFYVSAASFIGALVYNLILLFLSYKEYRS